jgi:hypothetical protein
VKTLPPVLTPFPSTISPSAFALNANFLLLFSFS